MAKSFLGRNDLPRGIRNNNPGNLVYTSETWLGKVPLSQNKDWTGSPTNVVRKFEQFTSITYGIRAKMRDIITDVNRKGLSSITSLINEFAPPFENNTALYISVVANALGVSPLATISLTKQTLIALCKAIAKMENGPIVEQYLSDADYEQAYAILGKTLASTPVESKKKSEVTGVLLLALGIGATIYFLNRNKPKKSK